ncbi:MAG: haloalkane dehalogenase [Myxococcota bacterium]|nr:haloalkane dehalogenase [Myxococcota bacterium]MEE2673990.1 haloalkane dehalogenase [Myxococcota bacterium]
MQTLRTPDSRFDNLPGYPFSPHYTNVPDGEGGELRIHHVEAGPADAKPVLCMHGQPTWSYLYRHMIPIIAGAGLRVVAPDLVGFGRSDKPSRREDFSYQRQVDWLTAWLVENDIRDATLVGQDWGGLIGLRMVAENPERFASVVIANSGLPAPEGVSEERARAVREWRANTPPLTIPEVMNALSNPDRERPEATFAYWQKWTWESEDLPVALTVAGVVDGRTLSPAEVAAYDAPFPDPSFKMGPRAMPSQVPTLSDDPSLPANLKAWEVLSKWEKPFLCAFSDNDPVTAGADKELLRRIPGTKGQSHQTIRGGGHFVQEGRGEELAKIVVDFVTGV